ncbi:MAG: putative metal-binding motif-containing protein [Bacteroidetes bacterium]|nr:putative metal-binding motif-containing protein [Bacteroidota bacterium]
MCLQKQKPILSILPMIVFFDVPGCLDVNACNYSSLATQDNGSCSYGLTFYRDADSDGYGDAAVDSVACFALSGFVFNNDDCNDALAAVNPGLQEQCVNSIDDNCNNIIDEGCGSGAFQLKLFVEGYYQGNGFMIPNLFNEGLHINPTAVDSVMVELRQTLAPYNPVSTASALLLRNGFAVVPFYPAPGSYYIVVRHRNTIETWSNHPVFFNGSTVFLILQSHKILFCKDRNSEISAIPV